MGVRAFKNLWISGGYCFDDFDTDLTGDSFQGQGPYIRIRFKFDENLFAKNNAKERTAEKETGCFMKKPAAYMLIRIITALLLTALLAPASALAWPAASEWNPLLQNGAFLLDPNGDAQGSRNIVSDATHAAAYIYNDGTYIYFRMRLTRIPRARAARDCCSLMAGALNSIRTPTPTSYEWLLILDGISKTENIILEQNTVQQKIDDPSDASEIDAFAISVSGNYQINLADTSFNGDQDYFLDFRFPYSTFLQMTGLSDSSPIRVFGGSSSSANALTERGADLLGSSTLSGGFTDIITPTGTTPTNGSVQFVENLAGTGDMTAACPGDALFVRVIDGDKNYVDASPQTLEVTLTVPSGDSETIVLTETGVNTSWFTGSIPTAAAALQPRRRNLAGLPGGNGDRDLRRRNNSRRQPKPCQDGFASHGIARHFHRQDHAHAFGDFGGLRGIHHHRDQLRLRSRSNHPNTGRAARQFHLPSRLHPGAHRDRPGLIGAGAHVERAPGACRHTLM